MSPLAENLAHLWWDHLPARIGRWSAPLARVMSDGRYLRAWPMAGAALPVLAFLAGFATGGFRPRSDEIFTMAIAWPITLLAFGALGAGLGLSAWLGFVIGDLFVFPHISWETSLPEHLLKETLPLLILYEVLLGVAVLLPLAVATLPGTLSRPLERVISRPAVRFPVHLVVALAVAAATAASWSASVQVLIRPLATFHNTAIPPSAVQTMRGDGYLFVVVAVVVTAVRLLAEAWQIRHHRTPDPLMLHAPPPSGPARRVLGTVVASFLISLALTGLLDSPYDLGQDLFLFAAVFGSALLRAFVVPSIRPYAQVIDRVPVLIRVALVGVLGGLVGQLILSASSLQGTLQISFLPVLITAAIAMAVSGILLPAPSRSA